MRNISGLIIFFGVFISSGISQSFYDDQQFIDENIDLPEKFSEENEFYIFKNRKSQMILTDEGVIQYNLFHDKIKINSQESIERNNKVYIPLLPGEEIMNTSIRVVNPGGEISNLENSDINKETDAETGYVYKYFALSGLQEGSIIEKIYLIKSIGQLTGKTIKIQDDIPILNYQFELTYPAHLEFKYKFYNTDCEAIIRDTLEDYKILSFSAQNLEEMNSNELYANTEYHLVKFAYKLDRNLATGKNNLNNYQDFAINVYNNINEELDKKSQKSLSSFIKKIPSGNDQKDQIRKIEDYIKSQIVYNRYFMNNISMAGLFQSKQANLVELVRLYTAIFREYHIPMEFVLTTKRFNRSFDKDFDTHENLDEILLYLPESKCYVDPLNFEYRTPLFNFAKGNNYGFFIKEKSFGGVKSGVGRIDYIELPDSITHDFMDIIIDFTKNPENPTIHSRFKYGGYSALNYQVIKDFVPEENYKEIIKEMAENYTRGGEILEIRTENDGCLNLGIVPFILDIKFEGTPLVQKAGNTILFKVGELIGNQLTFYENERNLPVEIYYKHYYTRNIKVLLPSSMTIKNPEDTVFEFTTESDGKTTALFTSNYEITDSGLVISNSEYYDELHYPLEHYEDYRKVINAAADFNKIVLLLEQD